MWSHLGYIIAFLLLAGMVSWVSIKSEAHPALKAFFIAWAMWYSVVLYYTPSNLMGWPNKIKSIESLPDKCWILKFYIRPPDKKHKKPGAIYVVAITSKVEEETSITLNPKNIFAYKDTSDPRIFKVPYSKETHKKILDAQEKQRGQKGAEIQFQKGRRGAHSGETSNKNAKDKSAFKIINPYKLYPK